MMKRKVLISMRNTNGVCDGVLMLDASASIFGYGFTRHFELESRFGETAEGVSSWFGRSYLYI